MFDCFEPNLDWLQLPLSNRHSSSLLIAIVVRFPGNQSGSNRAPMLHAHRSFSARYFAFRLIPTDRLSSPAQSAHVHEAYRAAYGERYFRLGSIQSFLPIPLSCEYYSRLGSRYLDFALTLLYHQAQAARNHNLIASSLELH